MFNRCNLCNKIIWFGLNKVTSKLYRKLEHKGPPTKHDIPYSIVHYHTHCEIERLLYENVDLRNELNSLKKQRKDVLH